MQRRQPVLRKFSVRPWALMASLLVLTILGGYFFSNVLDQARIGSQSYQSIISAKDLHAEAHASSLRLSEIQLAVQEIALSGDTVSNSDLAALARLENQYRQDYDVWKATDKDPATLAALASANDAAENYFNEVDGPFTTAARAGDSTEMDALVAGAVGQKYVLHEAAVDEVARVSEAEFASAEKAARQSLQRDKDTLLLTLLGLGLLGILLTAVTVRSMTSRLRAMRQVASKDFPKLVVQAELSTDADADKSMYVAPKTRGRDEMARTERAFHRVVGTAVGLATEQARLRQTTSDMLIYIGRRNHHQLSSGLATLSDLEGVPLGPERTSEMARLQMLMTRMRRDSESMLVVAGVPAMRSWSEPVSVIDAAKVALSEVEGSERIWPDLADSHLMPGTVGSDLAHMISELVDNALACSEPESRVDVTGQAHEGGYELLVADDGLGIEPQQLAALNDVLANGEVDLHDSRRLGLSVVARLAFRNDIEVSLSHKPTGGLIARIWVPPTCWVEVQESSPEPGLAGAAPIMPTVPAEESPGRSQVLPRRIRGASLDESLRDAPMGTVVIPELRSAESVRTTLSALAMGQLAASENREPGSDQP